MLEIEQLHVGYGKVIVVRGLTISVPSGSIVALLGPNGAGKTTSVRAIFGLLPCVSGSIKLSGSLINGMTTDRVIKKGMGLVPQGRELFPDLSVLDNLLLGAYTVANKQAVRVALERVLHYFPRLSERRKQAAGSLSGGEQQMLALGRALMASPSMLVLDEPSIGLAPMVIDTVFGIIARINKEQKVSILIAEQNARQALRIADYAYVLEGGCQLAEGTPAKLMEDDAIRAAYLGTETSA